MKTTKQKLTVLNNLVAHYGEQHWWEDLNWVRDGVSMILIQQSTQENVEKALDNLSPFMNLPALRNLALEDLQELIRPAGFYKQKANYLQNWLAFFAKNGENLTAYQRFSDTELRKMLLAIKGVGAETADCMLMYLFQRKVFIADVYAIRLFERLGFGEYKNYEAMRKDFQHLTKQATLKQCKEWHACIDVHGKHFRKNLVTDEQFLLKESL